MVGLKTVWITIFGLLLLGACVPQTKQTECRSNEAFNASLRTCVPVIGGPTSFITVKTYSPAQPISVYKNASTIFPLVITVDNPYGQTYTVEWERVYFGTPSFFAGNTLTTSLVPLSLASEIGAHFITAKIVAGGQVVDSHTFQINVSDTPRPKVDTSTVTPSTYALGLTPADSPEQFSFTVKNSGSVVSGSGYTVKWTVTKNGVNLPSMAETDAFSNVTSTGSNTFYLGSAASPTFDPSILGVGSYVVKAVVGNTVPGEIVDQVQWSVTVTHPTLSNIVSRNIYSGSTSPAYSTVVKAYNGVPYTVSTAYNFIPTGQATQGDFCVEVADGDGTYDGDSVFVRVDFYLDNSTLIYSGYTDDAGVNEVCLSDANLATVLPTVLFSNTTSTTAQAHTLTARVIDEGSNTEYATTDLAGGLGSYPITWNFNVLPVNAAPTVAFTTTALSNITCGLTSANAKNCTVAQDSTFTVGVYVQDEHYNPASDRANFSYTMTLYKSGSPISTCTKTTALVAAQAGPGNDATGSIDTNGPDYLCQFSVPSYDASGPVNPSAWAYNVAIVVSDSGSPISGAVAATANTFYYNLTVTEANTAPTIDSQGTTITDSYLAKSTDPTTVVRSSATADYVTEGETININVLVSDTERDSHQVKVSTCGTDATCASAAAYQTTTTTKSDNVITTFTSFSYSFSESTVPVGTAIGANVPIYFKIESTDIPSSGAGLSATSRIFSVNVRNRNPAPQIAGTQTPAYTDSLTTMVGYPLSIDPGTITDASLVASESSIKYQWYIDPTGLDTSYAKITGATNEVLIWTPSNGIAAGNTINIKLCVHDDTTINPLPADADVDTTPTNDPSGNGPNCSDKWDVTVRPNAAALSYTGAAALNDLTKNVAIWHDTTTTDKRVVYAAYSDGAKIFIDKAVFDANGVIYDDSLGSYFETVSFNALSTGDPLAAGSIKDISLAGDADFLFVAYSAAVSSDPTTARIKIRRIDKRGGVNYGDKTSTATYPHTSKFGYSYTQPTISLSVTIAGAITAPTPATEGTPFDITFVSALTNGDSITINGVDFFAADPETSTTLCAGSGCDNSGNASKLVSLINSSTDRRLQGFSAYVPPAGSMVTLYGAVGGEHLDSHATILNYNVAKLGKIIVDGTGFWYLPFIDYTTVSTMQNIRVLKGPADLVLDSTATVLDSSVVYGDDLLAGEVGPVNWFDNALLAGQMVIAAINTSNVASLLTFDMGTGAQTGALTLFSGAPVASESLRFSIPVAGNGNYFAAAKVLTTLPATYEWKIGRYAGLAVSFENTFALAAYNSATEDVIAPTSIDDIVDVRIQSVPSAAPGSSEARLLITSKAGLGGDPNLYLARLRSDNEISCGLCMKVNTGAQGLADSKYIAITPIYQTMQVGTAGNTANEHQKDVFFAIYPIESAAPGIYVPHWGIFNTNVESIQSTTTDTTGTLGHRPPFIGN